VEDAMEEGRSCKAGINEGARMYNVPPTTLKDKISLRVKHGTKPGPKKYLNGVEEEELATFLIDVSALGYGKFRKDVMGIAEDYARSKIMLRKDNMTDRWWNSFKNRQSDLLLQRGDNTAHVCMDAVNKSTIDHYFTLLKEILETHHLINSTGQIYNVDESGMPLDPKAPNVVAKRGAKNSV